MPILSMLSAKYGGTIQGVLQWVNQQDFTDMTAHRFSSALKALCIFKSLYNEIQNLFSSPGLLKCLLCSSNTPGSVETERLVNLSVHLRQDFSLKFTEDVF